MIGSIVYRRGPAPWVDSARSGDVVLAPATPKTRVQAISLQGENNPLRCENSRGATTTGGGAHCRGLGGAPEASARGRVASGWLIARGNSRAARCPEVWFGRRRGFPAELLQRQPDEEY